MAKIWIITRDINQYYQEGSYFISAFTKKPTVEDIVKLGLNESWAQHIEEGGGRFGYEDEWYTLTEIEEGKRFD